MAPVAGQRVDASALVDALRTGAALQQGVATHGATRPGELVQLLSAAVDGGGQDAGGAAGEALAGAALGALAPAADVAPSLLSTTAAQRTTSSSSDTLLLLTMAGSALALLATGLESARRQRVRAAVARGRGRRALR